RPASRAVRSTCAASGSFAARRTDLQRRSGSMFVQLAPGASATCAQTDQPFRHAYPVRRWRRSYRRAVTAGVEIAGLRPLGSEACIASDPRPGASRDPPISRLEKQLSGSRLPSMRTGVHPLLTGADLGRPGALDV